MEYIRENLQDGEHILWEGRPSQTKLFSPIDLYHLIFVMFITIAVSVMGYLAVTGQIKLKESEYSTLSLYLFFAVYYPTALYALIGRFLYKKHLRKKTHYYITNQRVLSLHGKRVHDTSLNQFKDISVDVFDDNTGTIIFGEDIGINKYSYEMGFALFTYKSFPVMFFDIDEVEKVQDIIGKQKAI